MTNKFCHLHVHTEYSTLDGFGNVNDYAKRAKKLGYKYLACTDHGSIDGLIRFQKACSEHEVIPIFGCEAYITPKISKDRQNGHILLLVKNKIGFANLCKILSFANQEGFYYMPRVTFDFLLNHSKGLIISSACIKSYLNLPGGIEFFKQLLEQNGRKNILLEVMPFDTPDQKRHNKKIIKLSKKYKVKVIATNDCHYADKKHHIAQEMLLAIQRKAKWTDKDRWKFSLTNLYLMSQKQMTRAMHKAELPLKYMNNTNTVAKICSEFQITKRKVRLPKPLKIKDENKFIRKICKKNFLKIFGKPIQKNKKYYQRFKQEYNLIVSKNFTRYFLIVYDFIMWCKENHVIVGPSRGSVGCSLLAYLMGITIIDSVKWGLPMDRFINEDRVDFPDIDIDIEDNKRQVVLDYLAAKYGANKVAGISTFNRMKPRAAVTEVARVFGIPWKEVKEFTQTIDPKSDVALEEWFNNEEGKKFKRQYPEATKLSLMLEGQIKTKSKHAAGVVINNRSIAKSGKCNVIVRNGTMMINWEKDDAEFMGLMKLDILSLKLLSILGYAKQMIRDNYKTNVVYEDINLQDKNILSKIDSGDTVGLFQLSPYATTRVIVEGGVQEFEDIVAAVALARPGPNNSGMTKEYIKRKHGKEWEAKHEIYERITQKTFGLLVYQEQVMAVINEVAGLPYSTADKIRKIIGKKRDPKEFLHYKKQFINGCHSQKTFSRKEAQVFWKGLQEWAKYGFNLAHSIGYAMLGYWSAWLKYYYPKEFICASLTYGADDKKKELIEEAHSMNLELVLPMVFGPTHPTNWLSDGKRLYIPFIEVKGIGDTKAYQAKCAEPKECPSEMLFGESLNTEPQVNHKKAFKELLESIDAYRKDTQTEITHEMQAKFDFRLS